MKTGIIFLIKTYQKFISPLTPRNCRYYPSCSEYMVQAVQKFGPIKGLGYGVLRILRCNPWSKGGYDPVPDK